MNTNIIVSRDIWSQGQVFFNIAREDNFFTNISWDLKFVSNFQFLSLNDIFLDI